MSNDEASPNDEALPADSFALARELPGRIQEAHEWLAAATAEPEPARAIPITIEGPNGEIVEPDFLIIGHGGGISIHTALGPEQMVAIVQSILDSLDQNTFEVVDGDEVEVCPFCVGTGRDGAGDRCEGCSGRGTAR